MKKYIKCRVFCDMVSNTDSLVFLQYILLEITSGQVVFFNKPLKETFKCGVAYIKKSEKKSDNGIKLYMYATKFR